MGVYIPTGYQSEENICGKPSEVPDFDSWGNDVTIRAYLKRETGMSSECNWEQNDAGRRRAEFCQKFEGYGRVCHCEYSIKFKYLFILLSGGKYL